jgi:UDP-glucose 4-epimerase
MKILITGGAGFIGTNLCEALQKNHTVVSIDNYSIGLKTNHIDGVKYIDADVLDIVDKVENDFDICFHLAGLSRIQPSFSDPISTFNSNTMGVLSVVEWCKKNKVRLIYAGSSSRHYNHYQSPYATFKYLGEEICKLYRTTYSMDIEITRFYNVYGPKEIVNGKWAAVIGVWRRQIKNGEPLTIVGDGEQRRDFTHVDDIVAALINLMNSSQSNEDAWELGTGVNYSINQVASFFIKRFNTDVTFLDDQPGNYKNTLRKDKRSLTDLNWDPEDKLYKYIMSL